MRIPDHAAVAATVSATGSLKKPWARGMTNAVLRRYQREREALSRDLDPAAACSHPGWLYEAIQTQWTEAAGSIIEANNRQPPLTLRVNSLRLDREDYLRVLARHGIDARAGALAPQAVTLARAMDVQEVPGFIAGQVSVQDEAAQLAAPLLCAQPGERVLDACAAPGGKACHVLELQPQLGELVCMDIDRARLDRVEENLRRLDLHATLITGDASETPDQLEHASFDRILVDAPCSASGVIRRHPDVKVLRRASDIEGLAAAQGAILSGLWPLLKPGGVLLYATCSILGEENSQVVARFVAEHQGALPEAPTVGWGAQAGCGRQVLPDPDGPDGLFFALLRKAA
jgi:16S rRNA (cytosine967-C5)-methyltransferase